MALVRMAGVVSLFVMVVGCCDPGPHTNEASRDLARDWLEHASGSQAEAFRDLEVSDVEYTEALTGMRDCLALLGFETTEIRQLPDGIRKDFGVRGAGETEEQLVEAWEGCRAGHLEAVESVFLAQHADPEVDRDKLKSDLVTCLAEHGVAGITGEMVDSDIARALVDQEASVEAWACRERFFILAGEVGSRPPD